MTGRIVIIGGGILGSCIALFLLKRRWPGEVVLIEPDPTYARSSTGRSASAIRQQFNLGLNTALSHTSFEFFRNAAEHLNVAGEAVDIGLVEKGYLVLFGPEAVSRAQLAWSRQRASGADVSLLSREQLAVRFPWLRLDAIGAASHGESGEGWFDPLTLLFAVRRKVEALGGRYVQGRVGSLTVNGNQLRTATLEDGHQLPGDVFVIAAGAQAARVAAMAGVALPVEARKRSAFVFTADRPPEDFCALVEPTFASTGIFARPYQGHFMAVTAPPPERDPDTDDLEPDLHLFEDVIRPALARRVRGFETVRLLHSWAGLYELNVFDQNGIVGLHPELTNLAFACGLSGHGVMHAPAIGRGLAELLTTGQYETLDLTPLRFGRTQPLDDLQTSEFRQIRSGV